MKLSQFKPAIIAAFTLSLMACGGSSSSSPTTTSTAETDSESMVQSALSSVNQSNARSSSFLVQYDDSMEFLTGDENELEYLAHANGTYYQTISLTCTTGTQTLTIDTSANTITIVADNCVTAYGTTDGTFTSSFVTASGVQTITSTYASYTLNTSSTNLSVSGTITVEFTVATGEGTITFTSYSATSGTSTYATTGSVTVNSSNVINGTLTITSSSTSVTCVFSNLDLDTATASDYASSCS